jgi:hypothetical protein
MFHPADLVFSSALNALPRLLARHAGEWFAICPEGRELGRASVDAGLPGLRAPHHPPPRDTIRKTCSM